MWDQLGDLLAAICASHSSDSQCAVIGRNPCQVTMITMKSIDYSNALLVSHSHIIVRKTVSHFVRLNTADGAASATVPISRSHNTDNSAWRQLWEAAVWG